MSTTDQRRSPLAVILLTIFIDLLGIGILIPVIPQLLANPASPESLLYGGMTLQTGYMLLGLLTASYPLAQFFAAPILGQLSDIYGRKRVLAISLTGTSLSYVLFALAIMTRNIPLLFASRILDGITGGNISVAQAAIADVSSPENRARNFGLMGAAFGLGFIFGPYLGGKLADPGVVSWFNASTPFWFAAILAFINIVFVLTVFRETNQHMRAVRLTWDKSIKDIVRAVSMKDIRLIFLTSFLLTAGFTFFTTFFSVYLNDQFGFTQGRIGDFFAYIGLWIAITQGLITPIVAKRFKAYRVLSVTMVLQGIMIGLHVLPTDAHWLLLLVPLFAIPNGLTMANLMSLLSTVAKKENQGEVLGINASLAALAQTIAPVLSSFIAAPLGSRAPIIVAAVMVVLTGFFFAAAYRSPVRA